MHLVGVFWANGEAVFGRDMATSSGAAPCTNEEHVVGLVATSSASNRSASRSSVEVRTDGGIRPMVHIQRITVQSRGLRTTTVTLRPVVVKRSGHAWGTEKPELASQHGELGPVAEAIVLHQTNKRIITGRLTIIGLVYPVCATCPYHLLSSLVISCPRVGILS